MYQKMYAILFNAITDALEDLDNGNAAAAHIRLMNAQRKTEELYVNTEPQEDSAEKSFRQTP